MKHLRDINIFRILKIMCIVLCAAFLFTACGEGDDSSSIGPTDKKQTIEAQRECYVDIVKEGDREIGKNVCPYEDGDPNGTQSTLSPSKKDDFKGSTDCIQASLLKLFYGGLGKMASSVYGKLTNENLLSLMFLAFSIWMAFQILRHVSATTPESLGEFWTKILRKATLCVACGILASSPENIYYAVNTFVLPVYVTLLEFASAILEVLSTDSGDNKIEISGDLGKELEEGKIVEEYKHSLTDSACQISNAGQIEMTEGKFPDGPANLMGCMACAISDRLTVGYTIALLVMNSGGFPEGFLMALVGIFLFVVITFVKWGFALYLVDSIFRLTMMITVMPFLILFFPFEQTRKWTTTGFKIILNSAGIMLCLAILVGTTIYAMDSLLKSGDYGSKSAYEKFGTIPLSLIFMGFILVKVSGLAVSLSDSVTGGGGEARFQKKMAALVGTLANGLFILITWGSGSAVSAAVQHSQRIRNILEKIQKAKAKINKIKRKMDQMAGRNQNKGGGGQEGGGEV